MCLCVCVCRRALVEVLALLFRFSVFGRHRQCFLEATFFQRAIKTNKKPKKMFAFTGMNILWLLNTINGDIFVCDEHYLFAACVLLA